jgi:hypothetical protein
MNAANREASHEDLKLSKVKGHQGKTLNSGFQLALWMRRRDIFGTA